MTDERTMVEPDSPTVTRLLAEYRDLEARQEAINDRLGQIRDDLSGLGEGAHIFGGDKVTVRYSRRFDPKTAWEVLEGQRSEVITACTDTVLIASKVKRVLPPALYERCQIVADRATVRVARS